MTERPRNKNRTVYDIAHSDFKGSTKTVAMTAEDVRIEETRNGQVTAKYLFTTETCPNCKIAKQMLEGEDYELVDAEKNPELARKFGVMQAPTLIVINGEDEEICQCVQYPEIRGRRLITETRSERRVFLV